MRQKTLWARREQPLHLSWFAQWQNCLPEPASKPTVSSPNECCPRHCDGFISLCRCRVDSKRGRIRSANKCKPPRSRPARVVVACWSTHSAANSAAGPVCYALESAANKKRCTHRRRTLLRPACASVFMKLIGARTEAFTSWVAERCASRIEQPTRHSSAKWP